jgi:hypothetical protein
MIPSSNNRHEVIVTDADLRSKRTKFELVNHVHVKSIEQQNDDEEIRIPTSPYHLCVCMCVTIDE